MDATSPTVISSAETQTPALGRDRAWCGKLRVRSLGSSFHPYIYSAGGWASQSPELGVTADLCPCPGKGRNAVFEPQLSGGLAPGRGPRVHEEGCTPSPKSSPWGRHDSPVPRWGPPP